MPSTYLISHGTTNPSFFSSLSHPHSNISTLIVHIFRLFFVTPKVNKDFVTKKTHVNYLWERLILRAAYYGVEIVGHQTTFSTENNKFSIRMTAASFPLLVVVVVASFDLPCTFHLCVHQGKTDFVTCEHDPCVSVPYISCAIDNDAHVIQGCCIY